MPTLIAIKELHYAGKTRLPGEAFEASDRDAKLLDRIGKARSGLGKNRTDLPESVMKAKEVEAEPAPLPQGYQTRHMTAEPTGQTGEGELQPSSRRGRRPRNLT